MSNTGIFGAVEIPNVLEENELNECLVRYKNGDMDAREKLIKHNLRLVIFISKKYFNVCDGCRIEFDDLVMAGMVGLIKGIDTYDFDRNVQLNSYISTCINNEILMYLRRNKKRIFEISLDSKFKTDNGDDKLKLIDACDDGIDYSGESIKKLEYVRIREMVSELDEFDRKIIEMAFGLVGDEVYTQREIAKLFGVSQSYISRKIRMINKTLKKRMKREDIYY